MADDPLGAIRRAQERFEDAYRRGRRLWVLVAKGKRWHVDHWDRPTPPSWNGHKNNAGHWSIGPYYCYFSGDTDRRREFDELAEQARRAIRALPDPASRGQLGHWIDTIKGTWRPCWPIALAETVADGGCPGVAADRRVWAQHPAESWAQELPWDAVARKRALKEHPHWRPIAKAIGADPGGYIITPIDGFLASAEALAKLVSAAESAGAATKTAPGANGGLPPRLAATSAREGPGSARATDWRPSLERLRVQFDAESTKHPHVHHLVVETPSGPKNSGAEAECNRWLKYGIPSTGAALQMRAHALVPVQSPHCGVVRPPGGANRRWRACHFAPAADSEGVSRLLTLAKSAGRAILNAPDLADLDALQDLRRDDFVGREDDFWLLTVHRLSWSGMQPAIPSQRWLWSDSAERLPNGQTNRVTVKYRTLAELAKLTRRPYAEMLKHGDRFYAVMDLDMFTASALAVDALIGRPAAQADEPAAPPPLVGLLYGLSNLGYQCGQIAGLFRGFEESRERSRRPLIQRRTFASFAEAQAAMELERTRPERDPVPEQAKEVTRRLLTTATKQCERAKGALLSAAKPMNEAMSPGSKVWSVGLSEELDQANSTFLALGLVLSNPTFLAKDWCVKLENLQPKLTTRHAQVKAVLEQGGALPTGESALHGAPLAWVDRVSPGARALWDYLDGQCKDALDLAKPDSLNTSAQTIREWVAEIRRLSDNKKAIDNRRGYGYFRPDKPPDWNSIKPKRQRRIGRP